MNIIGELMERMGIEQKELALAVGVSQPTISDWKRNKKDPKGENLEKVARFFGVSTQVIKGLDPLPGKHPPDDPSAPKTPEARFISFSVDNMPEDQRKRAVEMFNLMFSEFNDK